MTPSVLIVDDEYSNIAILERLFRHEYHTITAADGDTALRLIDEQDFDLVLLDIMMPEVSGLDVLKAIRQNPRTAELPVILISARLDEADIVTGLSIGANDYITKPFRLAELRARARTQITLKRLQDESRRTIDELRAAHEIKDRFFRIASHDLKGPITNLRLITYLVRQQIKDDDKLAELLATADGNLNTMQVVINEFLDTAALQSGRIDLQFTNVAVEPLMADLVDQYHLNALKKQITIDASRIDGTVYADSARLAQAVGNLLSNALKYSPKGSTITLWTESHDDRLRFCICDEGPGVPDDERDRLFTEFGKLSARPTDGESSTGLGLWIAKHLTTLQGGEIGVETPESGGSIFWIDMPVSAVSPVAS